MVVQHNMSKTSNAGSDFYKIHGRIRYHGPLPRTTEVRDGCIIATIEQDLIEPQAVQYNWKVLPHVRLANLPAYDATGKMVMLPQPGLRVGEKDAAAFVQNYGILRGRVSAEEMRKAAGYSSAEEVPEVPEFIDRQISLIFREEVSEFTDAQSALRQAWLGCDINIGVIGAEASQGFEILPFHHEGVVLGTHNLWNFICFMFMYDYRAGNIGVCACPDCVTPYFLKRRRTQKFCESGPCVAWAASQYTLKWWREKGRKRSKGKRGRKKQ